MSGAHTPGPWRVGRPGTVVAQQPIEGGVSGTADTDYYGGHLVAETVTQANAARIVQCVNAHDELVALLRELIDTEGPQPGTAAWADKVRAAIAATEAAA